jgi:hypothetical protein
MVIRHYAHSSQFLTHCRPRGPCSFAHFGATLNRRHGLIGKPRCRNQWNFALELGCSQVIATQYMTQESEWMHWDYTACRGSTMQFDVLVRSACRLFSLGRHKCVYTWKLQNCISKLKDCNDLATFELWYRSGEPVVKVFRHQDMHQLPQPRLLW